MAADENSKVRNFMLISIVCILVVVIVGCSVQCAYKNKHTDCGFTNDRFDHSGKKDPSIFYGNPR